MKIIPVLTLTAIFASSIFLDQSRADLKENAHKDILGTAAENGSCVVPVAAAKATCLAEISQGAGPFTVFATNVEAFSMLPKGSE